MPTHKSNLSTLSINQLAHLTGKSYNTVKRHLAGLEAVRKDGRTLNYSPPDALVRIYRVSESARDRLDRLRADTVEVGVAGKERRPGAGR